MTEYIQQNLIQAEHPAALLGTLAQKKQTGGQRAPSAKNMLTINTLPPYRKKLAGEWVAKIFMLDLLNMSECTWYVYKREGIIQTKFDTYGREVCNYTETYKAVAERLKKTKDKSHNFAAKATEANKRNHEEASDKADTKEAVAPKILTRLDEVSEKLTRLDETLSAILALLK